MKHHVERTSPKGPGKPFVGTCRLCGKTGLAASAALEDCENVRGLTAEEAFLETIDPPPAWPKPTPPEVDSDPVFEAIWQTIKSWDIAVPDAYSGYCGANGFHVRAIYDAVKAAP